MAVPDTKGFRVKNNNETGISKIATEAILDKAVTKAKLSQPVQTEINKVANKADQDGDYDTLTAGGAKQLLSTVYVDDNEPYNFRTAGGSADIGDRMYEEVVGGSIVWNQLARITDNLTRNGITITRVSDTSVSVTGTTTAHCYLSFSPLAKSIENHVYIALLDLSDSDYYSQSKVILYNDSKGITTDNKPNGRTVGKATADSNFYIRFINGVTFDNLIVGFQVFDLTQMFGSTIADYIYSLEQGTAGAGVAWFRKLFPKPYYAYNAGELMSVKAGSHNTVGFNAWDEDWELGTLDNATGATVTSSTAIRSKNFIPVVPNANYCAHVGNPSWITECFYDGDKNFISYASTREGVASGNYGVFTTPTNASFMKFRTEIGVYGTTYNHDICIHLAWDGERNGEYEPYEKHTYPLAELELRGIPKLDANNQLYYDGDTYASDGTVTRRFGVIDFGDLANDSFMYIDADNYSSWSEDGCRVNINQMKSSSQFRISDGKYTNVGSYPAWSTIPTLGNMVVGTAGQGVIFRNDSFSTAAEFKSALSGVYLVYELAEPTTETADTYVNPQVVNDFGTEEYVDYAVEAGDRDVAIPVGHNSQYMNNLRAKLEMAPDSPSGDGKYIVQQSNGENAYIPYTADGRLDAIEAKLPAPPSANGTYKLTATVTDGGVTYTWVAG